MKKLILIIMLLVLACENNNDNESIDIKSGDYLVLSQSSISSIDLYRNTKLVKESFYAHQNDGEQLKGYAENIVIDKEVIIFTVQTTPAKDAKIIITDKKLKKLFEIPNDPNTTYNPLYVKFNNLDTTLVVSYWKSNYPNNPDDYRVKKYKLNFLDNSYKVLLENDLTINGYGNARFEVNNNKAYFKSAKKIDIYNLETGEIQSLTTEHKLSDLALFNKKVYISYKDTLSDGSRKTIGGAYILNSNSIEDTIKSTSHFNKFVYTSDDLFVQTIEGSMTSPYSYSDTCHYKIEKILVGNSVSSIVEDDKLKNLGSSQYRMMLYDEFQNIFLVPGKTIYGQSSIESEINLLNISGVYASISTNKGEYIQVIQLR
jgi:hypothetical protein